MMHRSGVAQRGSECVRDLRAGRFVISTRHPVLAGPRHRAVQVHTESLALLCEAVHDRRACKWHGARQRHIHHCVPAIIRASSEPANSNHRSTVDVSVNVKLGLSSMFMMVKQDGQSTLPVWHGGLLRLPVGGCWVASSHDNRDSSSQ